MKSWHRAFFAASIISSCVALGLPKTDVVFNGIVEQVDLLKDHRDIAEQTVTGHVPHILTAYCDLAAVHIIETGNQVQIVVLPLPDGPTMAVVLPWGMEKLIFRKTGTLS